jgi:hypothetical protein
VLIEVQLSALMAVMALMACAGAAGLSIGLPDASILGQRLSARYAGLCRGVEVAAATAADLAGDTDAAYGYRVFLRHYCVHLAGPDPSIALAAFWADDPEAQ